MRVVFFAPDFAPQSDPYCSLHFDLIRKLADQNHDVQIITLDSEESKLIPVSGKVEVLRPLKKWNWLSVPKLIPSLLANPPDVMHFLISTKNANYSSANQVLFAIRPLLRNPRVLTSFLGPLPPNANRLLWQLNESQSLTVISPEIKRALQAITGPQRQNNIEVLPLPEGPFALRANVSGLSETAPVEQAFFRQYSDFILFPGHLDGGADLNLTFDVLSAVALRWPRMGFIMTGQASSLRKPAQKSFLAKIGTTTWGMRLLNLNSVPAEVYSSASVVVLAGLPNNDSTFLVAARNCIAHQSCALITDYQAHQDILPWQHLIHAYVSKPTADACLHGVQFLKENPKTEANLRSNLGAIARSPVADSAVNTMSRLYRLAPAL